MEVSKVSGKKCQKHLWPGGGDAEQVDTLLPVGQWAPFPFLETCFLIIIILTSTIYGSNTKHTRHLSCSPQQPYEAGTIAASILQTRDGAGRGQQAELGLVLGMCYTFKPGSSLLPFTASPQTLSHRETVHTYF